MPQRFQTARNIITIDAAITDPSLAVALYNLRVQWYFISDLNRNGFCDARL